MRCKSRLSLDREPLKPHGFLFPFFRLPLAVPLRAFMQLMVRTEMRTKA